MSIDSPSSPGTPPGWYQDGTQPDTLRWWDGSTWTEHTAPVPASAPNSNEMLSLVAPVGQSGWAIAAGYLGLFSLLLPWCAIVLGSWAYIFLLLGPFTLFCTHRASSRARTHATALRLGVGWVGGALGSLAIVALFLR